jgi:hypothetical protein
MIAAHGLNYLWQKGFVKMKDISPMLPTAHVSVLLSMSDATRARRLWIGTVGRRLITRRCTKH